MAVGVPAVDRPSVPSRPRSTQPAPGQRTRHAIRVLLADDEPDVRAALRALLEDEEAADIAVVGEAADGVEAICATERLRPDVLLLDLAMPKIAGAQAAEVLRQSVPGTRIVVLTATGHARAPELLRLDVHGYLCKPVEGPELAEAIRAVHRGEVCLQPAVVELLVSGARRLAPSDAPAAHGSRPTPRETEVLGLVVEGLGNRQIAARLSICERTVECHIPGCSPSSGPSRAPGWSASRSSRAESRRAAPCRGFPQCEDRGFPRCAIDPRLCTVAGDSLARRGQYRRNLRGAAAPAVRIDLGGEASVISASEANKLGGP